MKSIGKGEWKNKVEIAFSGQAPVLRRLVAYWLEVLGDDIEAQGGLLLLRGVLMLPYRGKRRLALGGWMIKGKL